MNVPVAYLGTWLNTFIGFMDARPRDCITIIGLAPTTPQDIVQILPV